MRVNIYLKSNKSFIKKILILILFALCCFLIKENVFALESTDISALRAKYIDYYTENVEINNTNTKTINHSSQPVSNVFNYVEQYFDEAYFIDFNVNQSCFNCNSHNIYIFNKPVDIKFNRGSDYGNSYYNYYTFMSRDNSEFKYVSITVVDSSNKYNSSGYFSDVVMYLYENGSYIGTSYGDKYILDNGNFIISNTDFIFINSSNYIIKNYDTQENIDTVIAGHVTIPDSSLDIPNWTENLDPTADMNILEKIIYWIKSIPSAIGKLLNDTVNAISDFLYNLFVPNNEILSNKFNQLYTSTAQQFGFLFYPFDWMVSVLTRFMSIQDTGSYVISWPDIKVPNFDFTIISSGSFDFNSILSHPSINLMHNYYLIIVDAICIISFINLCIDEYHTIFGGTYISNYESITEVDSTTFDSKGSEVSSKHTESTTRGRKESKKK